MCFLEATHSRKALIVVLSYISSSFYQFLNTPLMPTHQPLIETVDTSDCSPIASGKMESSDSNLVLQVGIGSSLQQTTKRIGRPSTTYTLYYIIASHH